MNSVDKIYPKENKTASNTNQVTLEQEGDKASTQINAEAGQADTPFKALQRQELPRTQRIKTLQRFAVEYGNRKTNLMAQSLKRTPSATIQRDPDPAAAPAPAPAPKVAASTSNWLNDVPDASDQLQAKAVPTKDKQGLELSYSGAAAKEEPGKSENISQVYANARIEQECQQIKQFRAGLPTFVTKLGLNDSQGAKYTGQMYTRFTDLNSDKLKPPKPKKKGETPVDTRTDEQKSALQSAKEYNDWLSTLHSALEKSKPAVPVDAPDNAEKHAQFQKDVGAFKEWLAKMLFMDIGAAEGGTDSINTYDKQIVTWGGGLGAASGAVPGAFRGLVDDKTVAEGKVVGQEVEKVLAQAGISLGKNAKNVDEFVVVDPDKKVKFHGDSALEVMKADPHLLALLSHISRGELPGVPPPPAPAPAPAAAPANETAAPTTDTPAATNGSAPATPGATPTGAGAANGPTFKEALRQSAFDQQRIYFESKYSGGAFGKAINQLWQWPYDSLMMALHFHWWGVTTWQTYYTATKTGDMKTIIKTAVDKYSHYAKDVNGAKVATGDLADHCYKFGGASSRAVFGPLTAIEEDKLESGKLYLEFKQKDKPTQYRQLL